MLAQITAKCREDVVALAPTRALTPGPKKREKNIVNKQSGLPTKKKKKTQWASLRHGDC